MLIAVVLALAWVLAAVLARRLAASTALVCLAIAALVGGGGTEVGAEAGALLPAAGLHLMLVFPTGLRRGGGVVVGAYLIAAGCAALVAASPDSGPWVIGAEAIIAFVVGLGLTHSRYVRAVGSERYRMQWLGWAVAFTAQLLVIALALRILVEWPLDTMAALATLPLPAGVAFSALPRIVGHVDRMLAHTVSAAGLTGVVVAVYLVIVVGLGRTPEDHEEALLLLSMVAAAVAALLYLPARQRLAEFANRLVYGERHAPDEALRAWGSRLSRAIPMDELLLQLAENLRKTMALRTAEVWTGTADRLERTVSVPERGEVVLGLSTDEAQVVARAGVSGPGWARVWIPALLDGREDSVLRVAPVTHSGEVLGLLVAERGPEGDPFGEEEEQVLGELARQVGLALHNVQLDSALQASLEEVKRQAAELQASRARIVAAGDAERRKIERNLHDGAQQHLVALAVNLRLARQLAARDTGQTQATLDQLIGDVQTTLEELRTLAHGIYPPLLMERGLAEALSAAAGRASLPTTVVAGGVDRASPEVEAAVYFCCLEALQNAGKHAGDGAQATVRVWQDDGHLRFEVADDGKGFETKDSGGGAGFVNMSDRLGAIGGSLEVCSAPGQGTKVAGTVPLQHD